VIWILINVTEENRSCMCSMIFFLPFFLSFFLSLFLFLSFFLSFCLIMISVYLLTVRVESYCYPWSHSMIHTTLGRTPLDERSARRRDLYLTTHITHNRQTPMPPAGLEPAIPASERPQTHSLDREATGIGVVYRTC
jgi:hypothetical protein